MFEGTIMEVSIKYDTATKTYRAYVNNKEVSKSKTLTELTKKLNKYCKGQGI